MKRYWVWYAVLGVIAIPAVAAACWPMWGRPAYRPIAYPEPMYAPGPVYVSPLLCQPAAPAYVLPPPRIEPIPKTAPPAPAPAPEMETAIPAPMPPAVIPMSVPDQELVRPAAGSDTPPKNIEPSASVPKAAEAPRDPHMDFPTVEIPKNLRPSPKVPPLEPDMSAVPKVPAVGAPKEALVPAIPAPAPPPEPLIPPLSVPMLPDANKRDPLPSLTLPPDIPVAPEKKTDSTSRSSPLTGGGAADIQVNVFPAKGAAAAPAGYCTVGFYNHTKRDLALTIEGRSVKLPAKTYLHAELAATFTWTHGNRPAMRETVPDGAGGVDVVFRD